MKGGDIFKLDTVDNFELVYQFFCYLGYMLGKGGGAEEAP